MFESSRHKPFPNKITHMAQTNKKNIAHISRKQDIIGRIELRFAFECSIGRMSRDQSVLFISAMAELYVASRKDLLRGRRDAGVSEAICIVVVVVVVWIVRRRGVRRRRCRRGERQGWGRAWSQTLSTTHPLYVDLGKKRRHHWCRTDASSACLRVHFVHCGEIRRRRQRAIRFLFSKY